jgi:hypothetical protein
MSFDDHQKLVPNLNETKIPLTDSSYIFNIKAMFLPIHCQTGLEQAVNRAERRLKIFPSLQRHKLTALIISIYNSLIFGASRIRV